MHSPFRWFAAVLEWCALAYLGYWLALFVDRVFADALIGPLLSAPVQDWQVSPFRVLLISGDPAGPAWMALLLRSLPMVIEIAALIAVACGCFHPTRALPSLAVNFCALWMVLFLSSDLCAGLFFQRRRMMRWLASAGLSGSDIAVYALATLLAALLLTAGAVSVRRLLDAFAALAPPGRTRRWMALLLVPSPVLVILFGTIAFRFAFAGTRWIALFAVPAAVCLLLSLLALNRRRVPAAATGNEVRGGNSWKALSASVAGAALLYAALSHAGRVEALWLSQKMLTHSTAHYDVSYDPAGFSADFARRFADEREQVLARLAARFGGAAGALPDALSGGLRIRIVLYPDFISKRIATRSARPFIGDRPYTVEGSTIHALLHGYITRLDASADSTALLHSLWGPPGTSMAGEWTAQLLTGDWRGRAIEASAAQIESECGHYPFSALVHTSEDAFLSPLVRVPLGAAWLAWVYETRGLEGVRVVYRAKPAEFTVRGLATLLGHEANSLEAAWQQQMERLGRAYPQSPAPPRLLPPGFFFRGVSFSHEGFGRRRGGYTGPEAAAQMQQLRALGANSISVIPYAGMRGINDPALTMTFADETDEELTQALYAAHRLGLKVMLKPQIWVGGGQFTGNLRIEEAPARARWFRSYREWIFHYARLAELEGFDLLCIGNELGGMTPYDAEWREIISGVRRIYHGPITYAANWGEEFETLRFWDAVDFAGLNNYYPLAAVPPAVVAELLPGAKAVLAKLTAFHLRWHKPILFTEIGYPSVRGGTVEPWVEDRRRGLAPAEQAAAYEAVFQTFVDKPWLYGMFWWKWHSSGRGGGPQDPGFTPMGKSAAGVLRAWYRKMADAERGEASAHGGRPFVD